MAVSNAEMVSEVDDFFKLPAAIEQTNYEYDAAQELLGMRQANTKGFLTEDGRIAQLTSDEPMHYLADSGAFEDINLNIMATPEGWEVEGERLHNHIRCRSCQWCEHPSKPVRRSNRHWFEPYARYHRYHRNRTYAVPR